MLRGTNPAKVRQWTERLKRFQDSSLTVAAFCRNESVSVPSFYQWKKKLAGEPKTGKSKQSGGQARQEVEPARRTGDSITAANFQPVELLPTNSTATTIRFPSGIEIELGSDLRVIELLVKQLLDRSADRKGD